MQRGMVESDPAVMMGKPVIAGTRMTVEFILEELGAGTTIDELVAGYEGLTKEAVLAALTFAAEALQVDVVYPSPEVVR